MDPKNEDGSRSGTLFFWGPFFNRVLCYEYMCLHLERAADFSSSFPHIPRGRLVSVTRTRTKVGLALSCSTVHVRAPKMRQKPTQPGARSQPTQPGANPANPARSEPSQPSRPSQPSQEPTQPTQPTQPTHPPQPGANPANPASKRWNTHKALLTRRSPACLAPRLWSAQYDKPSVRPGSERVKRQSG